jgi:uncharacterized membrane protein (UPF0127 family)
MPWRVINKTTGKTVVARLTIAAGYWSRLIGLQFRRELPPEAGMLLFPCNSVHTCFVRFPLDVVFLDDAGTVLAVRGNLRPWRLAMGPRKCVAVLELRAGSVDFGPADVLRIEGDNESGSIPPKLAAFLQG